MSGAVPPAMHDRHDRRLVRRRPRVRHQRELLGVGRQNRWSAGKEEQKDKLDHGGSDKTGLEMDFRKTIKRFCDDYWLIFASCVSVIRVYDVFRRFCGRKLAVPFNWRLFGILAVEISRKKRSFWRLLESVWTCMRQNHQYRKFAMTVDKNIPCIFPCIFHSKSTHLL